MNVNWRYLRTLFEIQLNGTGATMVSIYKKLARYGHWDTTTIGEEYLYHGRRQQMCHKTCKEVRAIMLILWQLVNMSKWLRVTFMQCNTTKDDTLDDFVCLHIFGARVNNVLNIGPIMATKIAWANSYNTCNKNSFKHHIYIARSKRNIFYIEVHHCMVCEIM